MSNFIKTWILMIVLTALFVWFGGVLGGREGAVTAFMLAAAMNFFAYFFSDKMVLRKYGAREVDAQSASKLYGIVARLAERADLPMPKVYVIPDRVPNAFATGRNPRHAAVAATEGIIEILDDDELAGVMAHELAHVKHRDILTGTIAATVAGALAMLGRFAASGQGQQSSRNPIAYLLAAESVFARHLGNDTKRDPLDGAMHVVKAAPGLVPVPAAVRHPQQQGKRCTAVGGEASCSEEDSEHIFSRSQIEQAFGTARESKDDPTPLRFLHLCSAKGFLDLTSGDVFQARQNGCCILDRWARTPRPSLAHAINLGRGWS